MVAVYVPLYSCPFVLSGNFTIGRAIRYSLLASNSIDDGLFHGTLLLSGCLIQHSLVRLKICNGATVIAITFVQRYNSLH